MNLESPKVTVQKSAEELFNFLSDVQNFEQIMPQNTDKFVAGENTFLFALKGMPEIRLNLQQKEPNSKIVLGSASDKFPFSLTGSIAETSDNTSEIQLTFEGSFNPMMAMMIKGPLQKFINTLSENIEKL
ncbi:MAG: SRPBCC family protein [Flavobacteriaceae bacterium]|jgi:ribosome-associated toxin RatA of RatAB toxin-antitoxin module|nr:SRPBCC family protein [Flavobacteriaceae bacterium]MCB0484694.1 SRPBCC family protein [Flavobacteriaceae bacterium]